MGTTSFRFGLGIEPTAPSSQLIWVEFRIGMFVLGVPHQKVRLLLSLRLLSPLSFPFSSFVAFHLYYGILFVLGFGNSILSPNFAGNRKKLKKLQGIFRSQVFIICIIN